MGGTAWWHVYESPHRSQCNQIICRGVGFPEQARHSWRLWDLGGLVGSRTQEHMFTIEKHINTHLYSTVMALKLTRYTHASTQTLKDTQRMMVVNAKRKQHQKFLQLWICKRRQPGFLPAAGGNTKLSIISMDWKTRCSIVCWPAAVGWGGNRDGDRWSWWRGGGGIYGLMRMTQQKVCTLCILLHTRVCEKPCLRKMQAGPTMLCSMLQFFTSVPKGLLKSSSSTSWSSPASTAFVFPSTTPFRGRQGYFHHSETLSRLSRLKGIVVEGKAETRCSVFQSRNHHRVIWSLDYNNCVLF